MEEAEESVVALWSEEELELDVEVDIEELAEELDIDELEVDVIEVREESEDTEETLLRSISFFAVRALAMTAGSMDWI